MNLLTRDPLTQVSFSLFENKGVFALLLGSGLSRAAGIPTGWEITLDLVRRVALAQGVEDQPDWAAWYRNEVGGEPNYSVLLEELAASPEERRAILHSYIEPSDDDRIEGRKVPTKAHRAIAELVESGHVRVIITTNFDRLLENALRERSIEPTVVASVDALAGAEPLTHSKCYVLKLHGDYKDARILNTEAELGGYPAPYDALLERILDEHGLIVSGWSGEWDYALRSAFLRAPNRRYSIFWAARGGLGSGATELVEHRKAKVIAISDADEFFSSIAHRVTTLEKSQRQNPFSIELMVGSTKRFLAKPEHRIQLDDLFSSETSRVLSQLNGTEFAIPMGFDQQTFRDQVARYESVSEALATMAGVAGRWGTGAEFGTVVDVIRVLHGHGERPVGGNTAFLNIRSFPAVLVFTGYALGLTRAERWADLHKVMTVELQLAHREPERLIETLFLGSWVGSENDAWKQLPDFEKRKTPLSDHLLALFKEWSRPFVGAVPDFELLFDRFEILGSLAYLEASSKSTLEECFATRGSNDWVWMPVGRSGWNPANASKILADLQSERTQKLLLAAEFATNDPEFVTLFVQNFKRLAGRMRW